MGRLLIEAIVSSIIIAAVSSTAADKQLCFYKGFGFGVATAAYQIEGAWNVSDKGESIWDYYAHTQPRRVFDHSNGDEATDSYHHIDEDVKMLKQLGVGFYRFSISWPRVLPTGFNNLISKSGIAYYNRLINELLKNNIRPVVTMYHWDLPQSLQDLGGWTNPIIADYFVDYARVLFENFGDRVKHWISFNEPLTFCADGYGGLDAPGDNFSGVEDYMCGHNVLRAHGMTYRMFEQEFKNTVRGGELGITLNTPWFEPNTTSPEDQVAAEIARQFSFGWFAHSIFSRRGDYPMIMRDRVDRLSKQQGFSRSRLPTFTEQEVQVIRGAFDFLGLNHYTTLMVSAGAGKFPSPSMMEDLGVHLFQKPEWPKSSSSWLRVVPWGFRKLLNWIKDTYDNPVTMITENGISTPPGLKDPRRIQYMEAYLRNLHAAIMEDGCGIAAYTHWSLMDNFEWMRGYSERFGLFEVDFTSPNKTRSPRSSALYFEKLTKTYCIPPVDDDLSDENY